MGEVLADSSAPDTMAYADAHGLSAVRAFVSARARALGLPQERAELLVLAVSELATNTLQHTSGGGRVRVWAEADRVYCEVQDSGVRLPLGRTMPPAEAVRGRGLAIVERVCDGVTAVENARGTLVRIWFGR